jgi:hypothetical protein
VPTRERLRWGLYRDAAAGPSGLGVSQLIKNQVLLEAQAHARSEPQSERCQPPFPRLVKSITVVTVAVPHIDAGELVVREEWPTMAP